MQSVYSEQKVNALVASFVHLPIGAVYPPFSPAVAVYVDGSCLGPQVCRALVVLFVMRLDSGF